MSFDKSFESGSTSYPIAIGGRGEATIVSCIDNPCEDDESGNVNIFRSQMERISASEDDYNSELAFDEMNDLMESITIAMEQESRKNIREAEQIFFNSEDELNVYRAMGGLIENDENVNAERYEQLMSGSAPSPRGGAPHIMHNFSHMSEDDKSFTTACLSTDSTVAMANRAIDANNATSLAVTSRCSGFDDTLDSAERNKEKKSSLLRAGFMCGSKHDYHDYHDQGRSRKSKSDALWKAFHDTFDDIDGNKENETPKLGACMMRNNEPKCNDNYSRSQRDKSDKHGINVSASAVKTSVRKKGKLLLGSMRNTYTPLSSDMEKRIFARDPRPPQQYQNYLHCKASISQEKLHHISEITNDSDILFTVPSQDEPESPKTPVECGKHRSCEKVAEKSNSLSCLSLFDHNEEESFYSSDGDISVESWEEKQVPVPKLCFFFH